MAMVREKRLHYFFETAGTYAVPSAQMQYRGLVSRVSNVEQMVRQKWLQLIVRFEPLVRRMLSIGLRVSLVPILWRC